MSNEARLLVAMAYGYPEFQTFYEQVAQAVNLDEIPFDDEQAKRALQLLRAKPELDKDIQCWIREPVDVEKFGFKPSTRTIAAAIFLLSINFGIFYKPSDSLEVSLKYEFPAEIIEPVIDFLQEYTQLLKHIRSGLTPPSLFSEKGDKTSDRADEGKF